MTTARQIKYLKESKQFKESEQDNTKYKSFLDMGRNKNKVIVKKVPMSSADFANPTKPKFQHPWLLKQPVSANELVSSEAFRILLGEQFAPKYRVCGGGVATRLLDNFTPWLNEKIKIEISDAEAATLNYRGNHASNYGQSALKYLKATSEIENFNEMLAVCLLFGKDDLHGGNWGVVDVDGKRHAATVDHELAIRAGFSLYDVLYHYGHRKEQLLTREFVASCRAVIAAYDDKKNLLKQKMSECINNIEASVHEVPSIDYVMGILEKNKTALMTLTFQIEAEMAIMQGDASALRHALLNLPKDYFPEDNKKGIRRDIISMQNYRDGFIESPNLNLRTFIERRDFDDCDIAWPDLTKKSPDDLRIESELFAVYDAVANEKHQEQTVQPRFNR